MLEARGLTKRHGGFLAVDRVSFAVRRGEILGYLGPNGSGKSTTVHMIVGLLDATAGSIALDGRSLVEDPISYKRRIGYVPEEPYLYTQLTATEYLTLAGTLRGLPPKLLQRKIERLLGLFLLHDSRYAAMSAYSKGMRQRVLLAAAFLHDPAALVTLRPLRPPRPLHPLRPRDDSTSRSTATIDQPRQPAAMIVPRGGVRVELVLEANDMEQHF